MIWDGLPTLLTQGLNPKYLGFGLKAMVCRDQGLLIVGYAQIPVPDSCVNDGSNKREDNVNEKEDTIWEPVSVSWDGTSPEIT